MSNDVRLLDVHAAAAYLGISPWTVRKFVEQRLLYAVRLPPTRLQPRTRGNGRLLFDRRDLDNFVDAMKQEATERHDGTRGR